MPHTTALWHELHVCALRVVAFETHGPQSTRLLLRRIDFVSRIRKQKHCARQIVLDYSVHFCVVVTVAVGAKRFVPSILRCSAEFSDKQFNYIRQMQPELRTTHGEVDILLLCCDFVFSCSGQ